MLNLKCLPRVFTHKAILNVILSGFINPDFELSLGFRTDFSTLCFAPIARGPPGQLLFTSLN